MIEVLTYTLFNFSSPSPPIVSSSRSVTNQHNSCGAICVVAALGSSQLIHAASVYQHRLSALASAACKDNTWYSIIIAICLCLLVVDTLAAKTKRWILVYIAYNTKYLSGILYSRTAPINRISRGNPFLDCLA